MCIREPNQHAHTRFILLSRDRYTCIVFHDKRPAPRRKDASSSSPRFSPSFPYLLITLLYLSATATLIRVTLLFRRIFSPLFLPSPASRDYICIFLNPEREMSKCLSKQCFRCKKINRFSTIQLGMVSRIFAFLLHLEKKFVEYYILCFDIL